jgi:hypothetical protein
MARLISLSRLIWPSTWPRLPVYQGRVQQRRPHQQPDGLPVSRIGVHPVQMLLDPDQLRPHAIQPPIDLCDAGAKRRRHYHVPAAGSARPGQADDKAEIDWFLSKT